MLLLQPTTSPLTTTTITNQKQHLNKPTSPPYKPTELDRLAAFPFLKDPNPSQTNTIIKLPPWHSEPDLAAERAIYSRFVARGYHEGLLCYCGPVECANGYGTGTRLEFAEHGDLREYLHRERARVLGEIRARVANREEEKRKKKKKKEEEEEEEEEEEGGGVDDVDGEEGEEKKVDGAVAVTVPGDSQVMEGGEQEQQQQQQKLLATEPDTGTETKTETGTPTAPGTGQKEDENPPAVPPLPLPVTATRAQKHLWALQIASTMAFIHACGVIHGNLTLSNILLDAQLNARVANFTGSSMDGSTLPYEMSSPGYVYPGDRNCKKGDVFAFGSLVFELLTGREPHQGLTRGEIWTKHRIGAFDQKATSLGRLGGLILKCWLGAYEGFEEVVAELKRYRY
ncbi:hypothetical protein VTJ04DRAFT_596 [Mycothermus thermophilus]|uniref:uncharacterized protein n=1 Tax=Humicola insolens TaxID=85995 RepID=UPI00374309EB